MPESLTLIMFIALVPLVSCLGCLFILRPVAKTSRKYQVFILKLKEQGAYEKWADQHGQLVFFEKMYRYFGVSVIMLVLIGFLIEFVSMPKIVVTLLEVVGYAYWPLAFIFVITIYNLYKKVPELQS